MLIVINVGLFAIQVLSGVNITDPTTLDALRWGADYAPLTFLEEPYRLFSSMFFHFGILHLMMNMWALYIFGDVAEKNFRKVLFPWTLYPCWTHGKFIKWLFGYSK